jgi:uncharacterized protein (DUF983 family)
MALPVSTMLRRGLVRHCPVCGAGHLFHHWVWMAPACPRCGLQFRRVAGHWLGSWFLNVCVTQTAVVLVLIVGVGLTYPNPPMLPIAVVAVITALVVPVLFFPFSRTLWSAIDLAMRPLEFDDGVAPGFELERDLERLRQEQEGGGRR